MARRTTQDEIEIQGLPRSARQTFRALLLRPLEPVSWLRVDIDRHLAAVRAESQRREFVAVDLAEHAARNLRALLDAIDGDTPEIHQRAVHAAARYFVLAEDGEHDTHSETGFFDDVQVFNAVARYVGRPDLVIDLPV